MRWTNPGSVLIQAALTSAAFLLLSACTGAPAWVRDYPALPGHMQVRLVGVGVVDTATLQDPALADGFAEKRAREEAAVQGRLWAVAHLDAFLRLARGNLLLVEDADADPLLEQFSYRIATQSAGAATIKEQYTDEHGLLYVQAEVQLNAGFWQLTRQAAAQAILQHSNLFANPEEAVTEFDLMLQRARATALAD